VPVPVPNTGKGNFTYGVFCKLQGMRTLTEGGSDNTFVGQNSPFFSFLSFLLLLINFNFGHRYE